MEQAGAALVPLLVCVLLFRCRRSGAGGRHASGFA